MWSVVRAALRWMRNPLLAFGLLVGLILGVSDSGGAGSTARSQSAILHVAEPLIVSGSADTLYADFYCDVRAEPSCDLASSVVYAKDGTRVIAIDGKLDGGRFRFDIPAALAGKGYSYWFEFTTTDGRSHLYPPRGGTTPIVVTTTADYAVVTLPAFSWRRRAASTGLVASIPYGNGPGELGVEASGDGDMISAASFAPLPDGGLIVGDWVHSRVLVVHGGSVEAVPIPLDRPFDLVALDATTIAALTLGSGADYIEVDLATGAMLTAAEVDGVPYRLDAVSRNVKVAVGPGVWERPTDPNQGDQQETDAVTIGPPGDVGHVAVDGRLALSWANGAGHVVNVLLVPPAGIQPGTDYFAERLPDGGLAVAWGLWDSTHFGVGLITLNVQGELTGFTLLPEPSVTQEARASTVRWSFDGRVLVALDEPGSYDIAAFEIPRSSR